ncbi:MAG TPA: FAD-dependent oxidoreductase [Burkholderiaceae bacterium]|nr:FAD-dependent oxidoreductase [Burkholderiaceae bacterium]
MKHVILGNGPAGVVAAETLRQLDPGAEIVLVGDEDERPYSRMAIPYLLVGQIDEAGTHLRKNAAHFESRRIRLVKGHASAIDAAKKVVKLADGGGLPYDKLLLATGSHPIKPPIAGIELPGVHTCWTLEDARAIARHLAPGKRVLQIGAGFIGCIILEALAERGVKLTVVEMGDRMVPRMMTPLAGNMIRRWVEAKGVRVITKAKVAKIEPGTPLKATLSTGATLDCDLIIASAGVKPNVDFLAGSGVMVKDGIVVDDTMRTSVPDIYAAGDAVETAEFGTSRPFVNAIQPDAVEQGRLAALNMAGRPTRSLGSLAINVLDTMGLISASFGQWGGVPGGRGVESADEKEYRYLSLQFDGDVLVGATTIGTTQHVGVLRGLIQGRTPLGHWRDQLLESPIRFAEAYVARTQPVSLAR